MGEIFDCYDPNVKGLEASLNESHVDMIRDMGERLQTNSEMMQRASEILFGEDPHVNYAKNQFAKEFSIAVTGATNTDYYRKVHNDTFFEIMYYVLPEESYSEEKFKKNLVDAVKYRSDNYDRYNKEAFGDSKRLFGEIYDILEDNSDLFEEAKEIIRGKDPHIRYMGNDFAKRFSDAVSPGEQIPNYVFLRIMQKAMDDFSFDRFKQLQKPAIEYWSTNKEKCWGKWFGVENA